MACAAQERFWSFWRGVGGVHVFGLLVAALPAAGPDGIREALIAQVIVAKFRDHLWRL